MLDNAVVLVGTVLENAAQETHNAGTEKEPKWKARYTMKQLLDPAFRLPVGDTEQAFDGGENVDGMVYDEVT